MVVVVVVAHILVLSEARGGVSDSSRGVCTVVHKPHTFKLLPIGSALASPARQAARTARPAARSSLLVVRSRSHFLGFFLSLSASLFLCPACSRSRHVYKIVPPCSGYSIPAPRRGTRYSTVQSREPLRRWLPYRLHALIRRCLQLRARLSCTDD